MIHNIYLYNNHIYISSFLIVNIIYQIHEFLKYKKNCTNTNTTCHTLNNLRNNTIIVCIELKFNLYHIKIYKL